MPPERPSPRSGGSTPGWHKEPAARRGGASRVGTPFRAVLRSRRLHLTGSALLIATGVFGGNWLFETFIFDHGPLIRTSGAAFISALIAAMSVLQIASARALARRRRATAATYRKFRKRTQSTRMQFAQNSAMFEATLNHMNQGLAMISRDGRMLIVNARWIEYSGVPESRLVYPAEITDVFRAQLDAGEFGAHGELMPPAVRAFFVERSAELPPSYLRQRPNGTILEVRTERMPNDGGLVQSFTDVTELMRAKEAAEGAARAKSAFLATMSHEIRTPLNGVLGTAALMSCGPLTGEQREQVRVIVESGDALMSVINDVLDMSKFEAAAVDVVPAETDLSRLLQRTANVVADLAGRKGIDLRVVMDADVPRVVVADGKRLRQVLLNLLGNAVKFTAIGHVRLHLSQREQGRLQFAVEDTGIGIPADAADRLFKEFSQVDASIDRRFGGTGLGLAISKKIVEAMGGAITFTSVEGRGSRFVVDVPAAACVGGSAPTTDAAGPLGRYRVLLAEDMPVNQMVARGLLTALGQHVELATNGAETVAKARTGRYDVIFMDMQMPNMSGLQATHVLRQGAGRVASIPIVAMTANAFETDRRACLDAGMDDFLTKPIDLAAIAAVLHRLAPRMNETRPVPAADALDDARFAALGSALGAAAMGEILDVFADEAAAMLRTARAAMDGSDPAGAAGALAELAAAAANLGFVEAARLCAPGAENGLDELDESLARALADGRRIIAA